jgi:hypothetical protein
MVRERFELAGLARRLSPLVGGPSVALGAELAGGTGVPFSLVALYGLVIGVGLIGWRALVPLLGRLTALAAVSGICGIGFAAVGALAWPTDPCETCLLLPSVGQLALAGALLPFVVAGLVAPLLALWSLRRPIRRGLRRHRLWLLDHLALRWWWWW